jgi:hypothetical protein
MDPLLLFALQRYGIVIAYRFSMCMCRHSRHMFSHAPLRIDPLQLRPATIQTTIFYTTVHPIEHASLVPQPPQSLLSTIHHPLSTIHHPLSTTTTIHYPESTIHPNEHVLPVGRADRLTAASPSPRGDCAWEAAAPSGCPRARRPSGRRPVLPARHRGSRRACPAPSRRCSSLSTASD